MSVIRELNCDCYIRNRVARGYSHQAISSELQQIYPGLYGLSTRKKQHSLLWLFKPTRSAGSGGTICFQGKAGNVYTDILLLVITSLSYEVHNAFRLALHMVDEPLLHYSDLKELL